MSVFIGVIHQHSDSVLALRIVFSICLVNYGARNLRLWQVILVWILAMDLLITAIFTI